MKKIQSLSLLGALAVSLMLSGCSAEEKLPVASQETVSVNGREIPSDAFVSGMVHIKVTEALSKSINIQTDVSGRLISTGVKSLNDFIPGLNIYRMERTFPYAGEYEARTREAGLHLWYDVYFNDETPLSRAGESLAAIEGVQHMEYRPQTIMVGNRQVVKKLSQSDKVVSNKATEFFDDPYLGEQWHYYNDGTISDIAIAGSDINVLPIWEKGIVGNPDVIVAVTDGGIDVEHEDLIDNLWTGSDEEGNPIHGYDFVGMDYGIEPDEHGTHVAGTIGAVNNNGIGLCGIAGGDKDKGLPGVKLMSCQIFSGMTGGPGHKAIKWSADNGAVISQNSWGYYHNTVTEVPEVDKDAIDYFIKYAGMDAEGKNQVGPMAGGVVIFAAGNDAVNVGYPQIYENCISVSAITSGYTLASYSNFGTWVDVAAPGGEANIYGTPIDGIISTLPGNSYGEMSGTSMACPHVSGLAALLVSQFGGPGFTPEDLKNRLLLNVTPIDSYNEGKAGLIGSGMINAERAVTGMKEGGTEAVSNLALSANSEKINFSFTVPGNKEVKDFYVYYSENPLNEDNFVDSKITIISNDGFKGGDTFSGTLNTGSFSKKYYVAVTTLTKDFEMSALSNVESITTEANTAPVIEALDGETLNVKIKSESVFRFIVKDEDGHALTPSVSPQFNFITIKYTSSSDTLQLVFNGKKASKGERDIKLTVEDEYGESTTLPLHVIIAENSEPVLISEFQDITFYSIEDEPVVIDLKQHIQDQDDNIFTAQYTFTGDEVAAIAVDGSQMTVTPIGAGVMTVDITISDPLGASVVTAFDVIMQSSGAPLTFYPNPVVDSLYIRANEGRAEGHVTIWSPTGAVVYDESMEIGSAPIDMSGYPAGIYNIKVSYNDKEMQNSIVKL